MPSLDIVIKQCRWQRQLSFLLLISMNLIWILLFLIDPTYITVLTNHAVFKSLWTSSTVVKNHTEIINLQHLQCSDGCNIARKYEDPMKIKALACTFIQVSNDGNSQERVNNKPIHHCDDHPDPVYAWYWGQQINFLNDLQKPKNSMKFTGAVFFILSDNATLSLSTEISLIQAGYPFLSHSHLIHYKKSAIVRNVIDMYAEKMGRLNSAIGQPFIFQPDFHFIHTHGYSSTIKNFNISLYQLDRIFRGKQNKVFWRGSSTGGASSCDELPRLQLCSVIIPWVDAKISKYVDRCMGRNIAPLPPSLLLPLKLNNTIPNGLLSKEIKFNQSQSHYENLKQIQKRYQEEMKKKLYVREIDWLQYKGIIDIDGHVNAWGLIWRLASGSLVFKIDSIFTNAYIDKLTPYVHYIPIKADLSDLMNQTSLVLDHTKISKSTIDNDNNTTYHIDKTKYLRHSSSSSSSSSSNLSFMVNIVKNAKLLADKFTYEKEVQRVINELNHFRSTLYRAYKDIVVH